MSLWSGFARRWLDLPAPRHRPSASTEWVASRDGARLATSVLRPRGASARGTVIVRSAAPVDSPRSLVRAAGHLLAEQGYAAVLQTCRGLHASEGRFQPFTDETRDGADLLEWVAAQPWFQPPLVVGGFGYSGHAAWAALGTEQPRVDGLVVGFAPRDPYAWLHDDRALRLNVALELAVALASGGSDASRAPDLARALPFRPLREADRVALRRIEWWREWLDHPRRDAYWEERSPRLAQQPGAALLIGGFSHPALTGQLDDYEELTDPEDAQPRVRLLVGPWRDEGGRPHRHQQSRFRSEAARSVLEFLDALCGEDAVRATSPVRAFVGGDGPWRDAPSWPPAETREHALHLNGDGREEGRLGDEPPVDEDASDRFVYDPADATPQAAAGYGRGDVLRYASDPLEAPMEIAGRPRVDLFAASSAPRTDFVARLLEISPHGDPTTLSEGLARDALREGTGAEPAQLAIELAPIWHRLRPGYRIGLELASASHPVYDRHPNTAAPPARAGDEDGVPALQRIWRDTRHASRIRLPVLRTS